VDQERQEHGGIRGRPRLDLDAVCACGAEAGCERRPVPCVMGRPLVQWALPATWTLDAKGMPVCPRCKEGR
jgi:hypothetical protein